MVLTQYEAFMLLCIINALRRWCLCGKKQKHFGIEKDCHHPFALTSSRSHSPWLRSLMTTWCLTCDASLCPGLATLGTLCWALPSPSSFPVAPQAPPKEKCRFQVRRVLDSCTIYVASVSAINPRYLVTCQVYLWKNVWNKCWYRKPLVIICAELENYFLCYVKFLLEGCTKSLKSWQRIF